MSIKNEYNNYVISGIQRYKAIKNLIKQGIECEGINDKDEQIRLSSHGSNHKRIIKTCKKLGCEVEYTDNSSSCKSYRVGILKSHAGLIMGLALSAVLCFIFSRMILKIDIENDNEQVRADILSVLDENGLHIGSLKSDFDFVKLERELKGKVQGISWAGISVQGSTIVIDTIDNIPKPKTDNKRLPCNVIALHDCIIDKAEVFCGDLNVRIGSGVRAGDILISGERKKLIKSGKDDKETEVTQYMRASGRVYGTFEKTAEFFFPYEEEINTKTGKTIDVSYLNIFDADIPLFLKDIEGNYTYKADRKPLVIFGYELPIALIEVGYSEYVEAINTYTDEEIDKKIAESTKSYEESFLKDFEIKDMKKTVKKEENGVLLTLRYTLYGEIGEQADIYLNKQ